ncbi:MAG: 2-oxo-4-hydroxy-4-carboxy-5-ureidoimidazoline decarboxylase [Opitutus sp.]
MVTLAQLNSSDQAKFTATLGHLFEHSPWVAEETWSRRPFRDRAHLLAELCATMRAASADRQRALIEAHPDLAGRMAQLGQLTAESKREQASAGLNLMSADEMAAFQKLNTAYRDRFGFPFIICARLNARDAIRAEMQRRIHHSPAEEHAAALAEIEKIAALRLGDLLGPE